MRRTTTRAGNQRLSTTRQRKQQHLLDVKVRSYKFKQQRNRKLFNGLCKVVLFVALVGAVWYGGRECLNRFLWRNADYNLTTVEINDDGTLSREQILGTAQIQEGKNIFSINLSTARDRLADMPQVEHVELERTLPGKITITISERKPIAWLTAKENDDPMASTDAFLIDRRGTLIRTKKQLPEYFHMPVIFGFNTDNLEAGQVMDAPEIKAALTLVDLNSDNTRFQIRSIDLSKGYCMIVTDQNKLHITFGLEKLDVELERLGLALDQAERMNKIIQTANLMVERNIPVTFSDSQADSSDEPPTDDAPESATPPKAVTPAKPLTTTPPAATKPGPAKPTVTKPRTTPVPVKRAMPVIH